MAAGAGFAALMYHEFLGPAGYAGRAGRSNRVADGYRDVLPPPLQLPAGEFAAQMGWLRREGYTTIGLAELRTWLADPGYRLPERAVLVTIDDLYQGAADFAAPVLRANGQKAVGFVCCSWIFDAPQARDPDAPACLSWPELAELADVIEPANHSFALHVRRDGRAAVEELAAAEAAAPGLPDGGRARFLADLRAAEARTGSSRVFAWPFGILPPGDAAAEWLAAAGMSCGFSTQPGRNDRATPRHALRRQLVRPGLGLDGFAALLA